MYTAVFSASLKIECEGIFHHLIKVIDLVQYLNKNYYNFSVRCLYICKRPRIRVTNRGIFTNKSPQDDIGNHNHN